MTYIQGLPSSETDSYIDCLINQVFSILPVYEKSESIDSLKLKVANVTFKIDGFFEQNSFSTNICLDVLSLLNRLEKLNSHREVRSCVLKICHRLTALKSGGE